MKISIFLKILSIMLILTIVPIIILGLTSMQVSESLAMGAVSDAGNIANFSINASTESLKHMGEEQVQRIASDVATQLEIYIRDHPSMTVEDLQKDHLFVSLATAPLGKTGYCTVFDSDSLTRRFHPYPSYVNKNIIDPTVDLPDYKKLMLASKGGRQSSGYFTFMEPDGSLRSKYAANIPVKTSTGDGVYLSVSAQVYLDEFLTPATETERVIQQKLDYTILNVQMKSSSFSIQNIILVMIIIWTMITAIASYFLAHQIVNPIIHLTKTANRISKGDLTDTRIDIHTGDEIEDLSMAFSRMVVSLKFYIDEYRKNER